MISKDNLNQGLDDLKKINGFDIRKFPRFTFGDKKRCKDLFIRAFKFCDQTMDEFIWINAYDEVVNWMEDTKGQGLFLTGAIGLGKSNIVEKVIPILFFYYFRKVVKVTYSNQLGKNMIDLLKLKYITIDEVGVENIHQEYGVKSIPFNEIIENVERKCNIVFISTNLNKDQMLQMYGARTLDRILRCCKLIKFEGKSLRQKG